jgi:His/Glu/Gln/Arg/opine family amino acid ABC transporter permease subunit
MSSFLQVYVANWQNWWPVLRAAAFNTVALTAWSFVIAVLWGLLLALGKLSRVAFIRVAASLYIELMRGVPTLVILFLLYFGIVPLGLTFDAFTTSVIGLGLHAGAYVAEILRSGIQAIHRGQSEAALAVGLTPYQSFRYIVLPQALGIMMPPLISMLVIVLKDTSICSLISTPEIMLHAKDLASEYFRPMHLYVLAGAMYFILAWPLSLAARRWGQMLQRGRGV